MFLESKTSKSDSTIFYVLEVSETLSQDCKKSDFECSNPWEGTENIFLVNFSLDTGENLVSCSIWAGLTVDI